MENIGNVVNFNVAYYWALAGVERAQLSLKFKEPWFEWSGGFFGATRYGPLSDVVPDDMWFLNQWNNGFSWNVTSRTNSIPSSGNGNVEFLLAAPDSNNYNMMDYFHSEKFILSVDDTTDPNQYYTGNSPMWYFHGSYISWILRLPPKIVSAFSWSVLCVDPLNPLCDPDGDWISDDVMVNWLMDWTKWWVDFSILPTSSIFYYSWAQIDTLQDTNIRESIINQTGKIYFGNKNFSPIDNYSTNSLSGHNVISVRPNLVKWSWFLELFNDTQVTWLQLTFGLVNLLRAQNGSLYPFLEYMFMFPEAVADRFYNVQGDGRVGDYDVHIFLKKPTSEGSVFGDFTVIF